jgi:zinc/manganese transport system substrate-binding protein
MIGLRLLVAAALATVGAGAAVAAPLKVVATFSVLGDMVSTIAGDRVDLVTIVGGDGDTELYQATPADARTLADADLLVENDINPEFEPWLEGLIKVSGFKGTRLVASKGAKIITEAEEEGHEPGAGVPKSDQHAWHDLANGAIYARNIGAGLAAADPANADFYKTSADAYIAEIKQTDAWAKTEIAAVPKSKRRVITSHDGFEYLGKAYGIRLIPARGWVNDREPSADDIARLVKQIRDDKVKAVFVENMNDPRVIERVAQEGGAEIGGTLYSDALSKPRGDADTYLKMARHNIATLKAGMLTN